MSNQQMLSLDAVRLYAAIRHLAISWRKRIIKVTDLSAAAMAGTDLKGLHEAQDEIQHVGLVTVWRIGVKSKYVFVATPR